MKEKLLELFLKNFNKPLDIDELFDEKLTKKVTVGLLLMVFGTLMMAIFG